VVIPCKQSKQYPLTLQSHKRGAQAAKPYAQYSPNDYHQTAQDNERQDHGDVTYKTPEHDHRARTATAAASTALTLSLSSTTEERQA